MIEVNTIKLIYQMEEKLEEQMRRELEQERRKLQEQINKITQALIMQIKRQSQLIATKRISQQTKIDIETVHSLFIKNKDEFTRYGEYHEKDQTFLFKTGISV